MSQKTQQGKTNKYSGVVKNVQKNQPKEEPKMTHDQVVSAFRSFGFEPNQRGQNDVGHWTLRPVSEGSKLMEELYKRRKDINDTEDHKKKEQEARNKSKETLPKLSNHEINAIYDEYGLPAPDPEWARNHLPNDPEKIRSILNVQRKMSDDLIKKHAKNTVNSMPETPPAMSNNSNMGMGGPNASVSTGTPDTGGQGDSPPTPFFIGDHALVRIANPNNPNQSTTWLVDKKKKTLQPFLSDQAFKNAFENPQEAEKSVVNISSKDLGPGGVLSGFHPVDGSQGINHDGKIGKIEFSPSQLKGHYGKQADPQAEQKSLSMLDGVLGNLSKK